MKRTLGILAAAATLALASLGTAHAAPGGTATITLTGGSLAVSGGSPGAFSGGLTLTGYDATSTASLGNVVAVDPRGVGTHWSLVASTGSASLACTAAPCTGTHLGDLSIAAPSAVACDTNSSCSTSTLSNFSPGGGSLATGNVTLLSTSNARGAFTFTMGNVTVAIPGSAYAGTYTATLTVTIGTTP